VARTPPRRTRRRNVWDGYSPRFNFGKHKGVPVSDVPTGYLRWVLRECECIDPPLRAAVEDELARRGSAPSAPAGAGHAVVPWDGLVARWYRELTMKWHPDRGGSREGMQAVNDAHDRLRKLLQEASA
jgi:hypothetical protein